ncbi:hypothetical protein PBY51_012069 [Eleginops maclovinus]|uniref:Uncharacterized protein n=1 Tax=Eleginops maclovinus TaxID=56733 RepID=A0AAN7XX33_ELEMC|nr:hypothetical protein PBY51_012069 [Eleginops maclovinus]
MSFSVKELCEMVNVSYDRVLEANVRVSNEEEDSVESDGGDTAANEDSLEHDPENDPDYTPVNEDAVAVDRGRSRKRANPDAWKDFSKVNISKSIRPGSKVGDPTVHDLRAVRYNVDGSMEFKLLHSDNWQPFTSPSLRKTCVSVAPLYTSPQKIKALKFKHLQELKHVLPKDFHPFYDALDHE